jgi:hypothetical protein
MEEVLITDLVNVVRPHPEGLFEPPEAYFPAISRSTVLFTTPRCSSSRGVAGRFPQHICNEAVVRRIRPECIVRSPGCSLIMTWVLRHVALQ